MAGSPLIKTLRALSMPDSAVFVDQLSEVAQNLSIRGVQADTGDLAG